MTGLILGFKVEGLRSRVTTYGWVSFRVWG